MVYCFSSTGITPTDDGGLKQSFQLQAMDVMTGQPQLTLQSDVAAEFWLSDLEPGSTFILYLYAVNVKGLSTPVVLPVSTLKEAAKRTVPPSTDAFSDSVIGAVAVGSAAGIMLAGAVAIAACIRCKRQSSVANTRSAAGRLALRPLTAEDCDDLYRQTSCNGSGDGRNSGKNKTSSNGTADPLWRAEGHQLVKGDVPCTTQQVYGRLNDQEQSFQQRRLQQKNGSAATSLSSSSTLEQRRTCLKMPPEFAVNMSDVPESCV